VGALGREEAVCENLGGRHHGVSLRHGLVIIEEGVPVFHIEDELWATCILASILDLDLFWL